VRVLFYVRANHIEVKGGDLVQLYSTGEALVKEGISIEYSSDTKKDLAKYDIVHIFNSPRFEETKEFFENALKQKKPIAFSTIFWSKDELAVGIAKNRSVKFVYKTFGVGTAKSYRKIAKKIQNVKKYDNSEVIEGWLFQQADILLPNSEGEMREIKRVYGVDNDYQVVCNAINVDKFQKTPMFSRKNYVLSVGRVERRKNTMKLIEACAKNNLPLVLIGGFDEKDDYAKECIKLAEANSFKYINHLGQDELIKYYYEAKVHAMVGWYETPGLSSMEAACGGCNIVSTDRGSTKEYFKDMAVYCDPFSQNSIDSALAAAITQKNNIKLRDEIMHNYTWQNAAKATIMGYERLV